jgi:hypothetical protein
MHPESTATPQHAEQAQVYLNIVLDDALEEKAGGEKVSIGMVVIRGNAVVMLEVRDSMSPLRGMKR